MTSPPSSSAATALSQTLMEPSPYLVRAAVGILDTVGAHCAFVGDSPRTYSPVCSLASRSSICADSRQGPRPDRRGRQGAGPSVDEIRAAIRVLPLASTAERHP